MQPTPRLRGRKAVEQRKRRLRAEPLCRICKENGRYVAAQEIDHIIPLAKGGPDTDDNCRALCKLCHEDVTRLEFGYRPKPIIGADGWPVEG